jgi:hypothetical protein
VCCFTTRIYIYIYIIYILALTCRLKRHLFRGFASKVSKSSTVHPISKSRHPSGMAMEGLEASQKDSEEDRQYRSLKAMEGLEASQKDSKEARQ